MTQENAYKTELLLMDQGHITEALGALAQNPNARAKSAERESLGVEKIGENIAVLSIQGALDYRADSIAARYFGLVDPGRLEMTFKELVRDDSIGTILMDIDSPGGSATYIQELSDTIYNARSQKRIVAMANPLAASAAFWIGTSASEFYTLPSGMVGSLGVYIVHTEISRLLQNMGVEVSFISHGEKKVEGNPYEPLSDSARETLQEMVDETYADFTQAVARNRNTSLDIIESDYGQGSVLRSKVALQNGIVDGILTLDELIAQEFSVIQTQQRKRAFLSNAKKSLMIEELTKDAYTFNQEKRSCDFSHERDGCSCREGRASDD